MVSYYGRNMESEENFVYCHYEDNVLARANSPEEAMEKAEKWAKSKRREVYRIDEPFAMPCRWFIGGWRDISGTGSLIQRIICPVPVILH